MQIQPIVFDGLNGLELMTGCWRMVVITECGPRIACFGRLHSDKNILYWDKDAVSRGEWKLYGGHRVWLTRPYADESEDAYAGDNEPCQVSVQTDGVVVTAPPHPFTKLSRGMEIRMLDDQTFEVTNFIRNESELVYSGGVWSPTCINPEGKTIRIPLGEENTLWDMVKIVIPRKFAGNTVPIDDDQISYTEEEMVIKPHGVLTKRCVCAPKGIIIMEWPEEAIRFTKETTYIREGKYPLDGCNLAVFVGDQNWMGEMETFGVEQSIRPGECVRNRELWTVEECN